MRLLLDTHVLLWVRSEPTALPGHFRDAIAEPTNETLVSAVSLSEIAVKRAIGTLDAPDDFGAGIVDIGLEHLPFDHRHARTLDTLPLLHRDPFDRMLVAQAIAEGAVFLTVDPSCLAYGPLTLPSPDRRT